PPACLEHFLLTVRDLQIFALYQHSNVTRMEPPSFHSFRCQVGPLVITQHHIGAFAKYLAVLCDLDLYVRDDRTYTTEHTVFLMQTIDADHRRGLSKAISFQDGDAGSREDPYQSYLAGSAAAGDTGKVIAQRLPPFAEYKFIG